MFQHACWLALGRDQNDLGRGQLEFQSSRSDDLVHRIEAWFCEHPEASTGIHVNQDSGEHQSLRAGGSFFCTQGAMMKIAQCSQLDLELPSLMGGPQPYTGTSTELGISTAGSARPDLSIPFLGLQSPQVLQQAALLRGMTRDRGDLCLNGASDVPTD